MQDVRDIVIYMNVNFLPVKDLSHECAMRDTVSPHRQTPKPKDGSMRKRRTGEHTLGSGYFLQCTNATSPPITSTMQVNKARASLLVQLSISGG